MLRFLIIALIVFPLCLFSQDIRVTCPDEVGVNDYFELKYTVENADVEDIELPRTNDFVQLSGPNTSTSASVIFSNGKRTQTKTATYTYILEPKREGTFTLPAAVLKINGKKVSSRTATVKVVEGSGTKSATRGVRQTPIKNITDKDLFVRTIVSKTKVMEQEALELTYRVYWKTGVSLSNIYIQKAPDFKGFVVNDIPSSTLNLEMETVNGETFKVVNYMRYILYPQQEGEWEIAPITLDCEIVESDPTMDALDAFFNGRMRSRTVNRKSQKLTIDVTPLPQPRPDDFLGVVGALDMQGKWVEPSIHVGTPAHYQVTMQGAGNLKLMLPPTLKSNTVIDFFDVETNEELELTTTGHKGKVVYNYTFTPKSAGKLVMPLLTGSYFNTTTGRYEKLTLQPTEREVYAVSTSQNTTASNDHHLQDIHTIHPGNHKVIAALDYIHWGNIAYFAYYLVTLIAATVIFYAGRKYLKRDRSGKVQKGALRNALNQLKEAEELINHQEYNKFYILISEVINNFLFAKYKLEKTDLSKQHIEVHLMNKHVETKTIARLLKVIEECEFAKFAPTKDEGGVREILNEVTEVLHKL